MNLEQKKHPLKFVAFSVLCLGLFVGCSSKKELKKQPASCEYSPKELAYGEQSIGVKVRQLRVVVENSGDEVLQLTNPRFSEEIPISVTLPEEGILPHSEGFVLFDLDNKAAGPLESSFRVDTNSAVTPLILVKISGALVVKKPRRNRDGDEKMRNAFKEMRRTQQENAQKALLESQEKHRDLPISEQPL